MLNCPKCGRQLRDGIKFCTACGTPILRTTVANNMQRPVNRPVQDNQPRAFSNNLNFPINENSNKKIKTITISAVSLVLVALVVCGIVFSRDIINGKNVPETADSEIVEVSQKPNESGNNGETSQSSADNKTEESQTNNNGGNKGEATAKKYRVKKETYYNSDNSFCEWAEYKYDSQGNVISKKMHDENSVLYCEDIYAYDANGRLIKEIIRSEGAIGSWTEYSYENNRIVKESHCSDNGVVYAEYLFEYDAKGNMVREIYVDSDGSSRISSEYEYDSKGNVIKEKGFFGDSYEYEYDSKGNRTKSIEFLGGELNKIKVWEYNDKGEITKYIWYNDDNTIEQYIEYKKEYDSHGNLVKELYCSYDGETDGYLYDHEYDDDNNISKTTIYYYSGNEMAGWIVYEYEVA